MAEQTTTPAALPRGSSSEEFICALGKDCNHQTETDCGHELTVVAPINLSPQQPIF